jgi:hypothetical protein
MIMAMIRMIMKVNKDTRVVSHLYSSKVCRISFFKTDVRSREGISSSILDRIAGIIGILCIAHCIRHGSNDQRLYIEMFQLHVSTLNRISVSSIVC